LTSTKICSQGSGVYSICSTAQSTLDEWSGVLVTPTAQLDVAFNGNASFFVVYVKVEDPNNSQANSIMGIQLDINGVLVGSPIPIFPYSMYSDPKWNPHIVFNPSTQQYLVVFEFGQYSETDIMAVFVSASGNVGTVIDLISAPGRQASPALVYNSLLNEYMLAYETNSTFLSNSIVAIGYARLTGSLNVTTSGLIQACNSYCSNTYQPSVAVDISLGNYMIVFETQPVGTTNNALAVWVITPSNSQSYQDGVSYAYVLPGTNTTYILSEQTPELVFASNNGSFALVFQAIVNQNAPPSLIRNAVFLGSATESGIVSLPSITRVLSNIGDVINSDPNVKYSSGANLYILALTTQFPNQASNIAFVAYDASTLQLVSQIPQVNTANNNSSASTPVIVQVGNTENYIVLWISGYYQPPPASVVTNTKVTPGIIAAAVIVPMATIIILVGIGTFVWYKYLRIEFQHAPVGAVATLPDDGKYDAEGKPLYSVDGKPLYDADGNPLYDSQGNPLYDEDGYPLYDTEGNPLYDSEGNSLFSVDTPQSVVKVGNETFTREEFFKKKETGLLPNK